MKAGKAPQIWLGRVCVVPRGCLTRVPEPSVQGAVTHSGGPGSEKASQTLPETGDGGGCVNSWWPHIDFPHENVCLSPLAPRTFCDQA